jgi:hypothetical protein
LPRQHQGLNVNIGFEKSLPAITGRLYLFRPISAGSDPAQTMGM